jgi:trimethylamine--corrinoid protein Co-methyltransferase
VLSGKEPKLQFVSIKEIERIHETSLRILRELGIQIEDPRLRNQLSDLGCAIQGERVKFPAQLVEKVIANVKKHNHLTLTSRSGRQVEITPDSVRSHTTGGIPDIIDLETGIKRRSTKTDIIATTKLMNRLDQLGTPCALLYANDVAPQINQITQTELMLRYSEKPIYGPGISSPGEAKYIVELFRSYAGSAEVLAKNPVGIVGISPESPLKLPQVVSDTIREVVSAGVPVSILSAPLGGLSAPVTMAGGLAQTNAEILAFAAVAYAINPETPLFYGARLFFNNMKNGCTILGLPEVGVVSAVSAQIAAYYGFLPDLYGLATTSCTVDNQNGYERAVNCLLPALAGANWLSGFGALASVMVSAYEQLIIDNELFALIKKAAAGLTVDDDTLGFDVLAKVINGGMFLTTPHTVKHLRRGEIFIPTLGFDSVWSTWEKEGCRDIRTVARERAYDLLRQDDPAPLPAELDREVQRIMSAAAKELVP